jgi:hypothetical protein
VAIATRWRARRRGFSPALPNHLALIAGAAHIRFVRRRIAALDAFLDAR